MNDTFYEWYKTQDADKTFEHLGVREIAFISFEAGRNSIPLDKPVKPACEIERPKLQDFLPEDTTTDMVNNMFLENTELYNYINALDNYIDHIESKSV